MRVLGPNDPSVNQVKALLEMTQSMPLPQQVRRSSNLSNHSSHDVPSASRNSFTITPSPTERDEESMYQQHFPSERPPRTAVTPSRIQQPSIADDVSGLSHAPIIGAAQRSIFRTSSTEAPLSTTNRAPLLSVSVSTDNDRAIDRFDDFNESTKIHLVSQEVPETSFVQNDSDAEIANSQDFEESFDRGISLEATKGGARAMPKSYSYDAEEHCLLSDTGVDSEHGRIHFPMSWSGNAAISQESNKETVRRDIVVSRPYRGRKPPVGKSLGSNSNVSERWGSDTVNYGSEGCYSTGNKERDELMSRARAILQAHKELPEDSKNEDSLDYEDAIDGHVTKRQELVDFDHLEDGVAPLGGEWPKSNLKEVSVRDMVYDPMNNMQELYTEAVKRLNAENYPDAIRLFGIILSCQKRRHGPLHSDVASALHNIGIAHLRAQNHNDALKAFEEAARVRKGSLGREHPQVAVSLVKVGISLLLLHRFEEALWSFREALSVRKQAMGPSHPSTARIYNNIGCVHVEFDEFREARHAFETALDIQRKALTNDPDSGQLMFGTATTLCNLGYLYRYREMHAKAALVLKEAVDLQERVLGRSDSAVLSTMDILADSYANSGQAEASLKYYNMILERFRVTGPTGSKKVLRAEAVLLYKMSRVHSQRNDREAQLDTLKLSLRSIRLYSSTSEDGQTDPLERRIQSDIRECRESLEKNQLKWI